MPESSASGKRNCGIMADLLVDQGNSRIKLGWLDREIREIGILEHPGEIPGRLPATPGRIWLSSVAGAERREALVTVLRGLGGTLGVVGAGHYRRYLPTRYAPAELGADRWLAALAGYRRGQGACVVVDAGTATTIELVEAGGVHAGGYILPGEEAMARAIEHSTAIRLPLGDVDCGQTVPLNTLQAVRCGGLAAQAALVEQARQRLWPDCPIYIGGGNGARLAALLGGRVELVPNLVLEGLGCLARQEEACAG